MSLQIVERGGVRRGGPVRLRGILIAIAIGAVGCQDRVIEIANEEATLGDRGDYVGGLAISPDGKCLASSRAQPPPGSGLKLWDLATSKELRPLDARFGAGHLEFSPDGKTLLIAWGGIGLVDVATGKTAARLRAFGGPVNITCAAWSPDGKTVVATGPRTEAVMLWDTASGEPAGTLDGHVKGGWSVAFSPDGKTIALAGNDGEIKLWDFAARKEIATLKVQDRRHGELRTVAFSPDGKTIASAGIGPGAPVRLWDVATRRLKATLARHNAAVYAVAFTPNGKGLVSASVDCTAILWDVATGRPKAVFHGATLPFGIWSLAISRDGKTLLAGCGDGTIKRWNMPTDEQLR